MPAWPGSDRYAGGRIMRSSKRQLAASLRVCPHVADGERIAGFIADEATEVSVNPFWQTCVGAQRHVWAGQALEFRSSRIASLGLVCLLKALDALAGDEPLVQEIFRAGSYRAYVYHRGDGCRIVGAVLHGQSQKALPTHKRLPRIKGSRPWAQARFGQLDLFAL
jgi:hypothetical protein